MSQSPGIRAFDPGPDLGWAVAALDGAMGGRWQTRRGELIDVLDLPGLVAEVDGERMGLLTYRLDGEGCEIAVLLATTRRSGVGTALIDALRGRVGRQSLWVVTTNDNVDALRFYQRRGFRLRALRAGAVDDSRRLVKPEIPPRGDYGIPLRDELELVSDPAVADEVPIR
jgi:ribosomal protein S18 acetylase RimI-like enzyme